MFTISRKEKSKEKNKSKKEKLIIGGVDARLGRTEKQRLTLAVKKAKRDGKIPKSAQQTIAYQEIYPDGLCKIKDKLYTKTMQFSDINYQLARPEDKTQIFELWCDFFNYMDPSIKIQLSFVNEYVNRMDYEKSIDIPKREDGFDDVRREYSEMLSAQLGKGNNGLIRKKYLTFGIYAEDMKTARLRLERIEADLIGNLKALGVKARTLSGLERLKVLHNAFHPGGQEKLRFAWDSIVKTGLSTKDFISPSSFDFRDSKTFQMGSTLGAVSFVQIIAPEINDRMLSDLLNLDSASTVTFHIRSLNQAEAIKAVKRKLTDIEKGKIEEQKKAVRSGYDMDVLPPDLITYAQEAKNLLNSLQSHNERLFLVTMLIMNTSESRKKLENSIFQTAGIVQKHNCSLKRLDFLQEQGLMSSLPIGENHIEIERSLTTSSIAIFIPFTTEELFMDGESLYYGLNALSHNLIMADRKRLKNPNGLFLGVPGSGKSFAAKREIVNAFLITEDDVIISDPEAEYAPLVNRLGGQVVKLSPVSKHYVNPMDINPDYSDEEDPLTLKSDFILSLCELIVGGKDGLQPVEKTIIDRCTRLVYRNYLTDPKPKNMPILGDLHALLKEQPEAEAARIATALEIYVTGSLNVFNHRTNVNLNNRLICYDIKELGKALKKIAMLILQDQVWNRVTLNRAAHKTTWFYQDEFHLMLKDEQTAAYSVEVWKRFRKWGGVPSGLTQNIKDLLASREIENIFENSDFIYMLSQAAGDRAILAKQLGISPTQLSYVTHSNPGEGLLFYGNTIIPFVDHFPHNHLYSIMTTRPEDLMEAADEEK